ncbi:cobalt-precorrin-6A reductase [Rhodobacterales bacterium]|nr:cobalt-precorrin-6A reductase [Rhodobacterales bacterium]
MTIEHVLLLAGTLEARKLAGDIAARIPALRITASFAGAVSDLPDLGVPTRVGGFGGAEGLAAYLRSKQISLVIDATHPFAAQMSRNAADAALAAGIDLVRLERPAWAPGPGDHWLPAGSVEEAVSLLPAGARAFLAIGRKDIGLFAGRGDIYGLARMIEPPGHALPAHWDVVLERPARSQDAEKALLSDHSMTHVVAKNSGGTRSHAKIAAARSLGLPVIMIERPQLPPARTAGNIVEILEVLAERI